MGRDKGGERPPVDGGLDLGALRGPQVQSQDRSGEESGFYVNDVQPTVETDGGITLGFAHLGPAGRSNEVRVTLPAGLFAELVSLAPDLLTAATERHAKQAQRLAAFLRGAQQAAQAEATHHGGAPVDLEQRRGG
jgi:hypothetical protein